MNDIAQRFGAQSCRHSVGICANLVHCNPFRWNFYPHPQSIPKDLFAANLHWYHSRKVGEVTDRIECRLIGSRDRTPSASRSYFSWFHTLRVVPDKFVLYHEHLDSYLYLRFLRTLIFLCVVGCCITWPVLFPVNATGGGNSSQLDRISIGNVSDKKKLYAHAAVAYVYFGFVMFTVARERIWLIGLRQAWNLSRPMARRLSSKVVLFLSAPAAALDQNNVQRIFGEDAVRVWPATSADKLHSLVSSRDAIVEELEAAELKLIENVKRKLEKSGSKGNSVFSSYNDLPNHMKKSLRPTHTLKTPPIGEKVDSIDHYQEKLKEKEEEIQKARDSNANAASHGGAAAVFIEFKTQAAAQRAYQQIASAEILALNPRYTSVLPGEIIWKNLVIAPAKRISQQGLATVLVVAIIVFWSIPISFVGAWSNVRYLASTYSWLSWLNRLPESILNLLAGLVPAALLSALASFVPNIFRAVFKAFGEPTNTSVELKVLRWYFVFQVLQVFLVNTLASGAAAVLSQAANNPASIPTILANNLPSAANSYLTYFIVQGLTNASNNMLNYSDLLSYLFFDRFFDKTPRQKYNRFIQLKGIQWGKVFPKYGNFLIIGKHELINALNVMLIYLRPCIFVHCAPCPRFRCCRSHVLLLQLPLHAPVYRLSQDRYQGTLLHTRPTTNAWRHLHRRALPPRTLRSPTSQGSVNHDGHSLPCYHPFQRHDKPILRTAGEISPGGPERRRRGRGGSAAQR